MRARQAAANKLRAVAGQQLRAVVAQALRLWLALVRRRRELQALQQHLQAGHTSRRLRQSLLAWREAAADAAARRPSQQQLEQWRRRLVLLRALGAWQRGVQYAQRLAAAAEALAAVASRLQLPLRLVFGYWRRWVQEVVGSRCRGLRAAVQLRACLSTWRLYVRHRRAKRAALQAAQQALGGARLRACLAAWRAAAEEVQAQRQQEQRVQQHWRRGLLLRALLGWQQRAGYTAWKGRALQQAAGFR